MLLTLKLCVPGPAGWSACASSPHTDTPNTRKSSSALAPRPPPKRLCKRTARAATTMCPRACLHRHRRRHRSAAATAAAEWSRDGDVYYYLGQCRRVASRVRRPSQYTYIGKYGYDRESGFWPGKGRTIGINTNHKADLCQFALSKARGLPTKPARRHGLSVAVRDQT